jgi:DNA-binding response OmpR family regulator
MADEDATYFRTQARKCRNLAATSLDQRVSAALETMADEYVQKAMKLEELARR